MWNKSPKWDINPKPWVDVYPSRFTSKPTHDITTNRRVWTADLWSRGHLQKRPIGNLRSMNPVKSRCSQNPMSGISKHFVALISRVYFNGLPTNCHYRKYSIYPFLIQDFWHCQSKLSGEIAISIHFWFQTLPFTLKWWMTGVTAFPIPGTFHCRMQKCLVYHGKSPSQMDDWGYPYWKWPIDIAMKNGDFP